MSTEITFDIPNEMKPVVVAKCFAAYLLAWNAFNRSGKPWPRQVEGNRWQLDPTNDYWFSHVGSRGRLSCRYSNKQETTIHLMFQLFILRYGSQSQIQSQMQPAQVWKLKDVVE